MTLLNVSATNCIWSPRTARTPDLAVALDNLPPDAPVPILVHGYRYDPGLAGNDPHDLILSARDRTDCGHLGWPFHLGYGQGTDRGLCIGFGWQSGGTLWQARAEAVRAGLALAALVTRIRALSPGRRVTVLAHSLGARVLFSALPAIDAGDIARAVLMVPATLRAETRRALATPAGQSCEFVNVVTAENRLFDFGLELLVAGGLARSVGRGLAAGRNWADLAIDCPSTRAHLAALGFAIPAPDRTVCHWSSYQRAALFDLYRTLIATPCAQTLSLDRLRPPGAACPVDPTCTSDRIEINYA